MIIDYESKYTFPLTNDSLRHICGVNTTYVGIRCGYRIFSPNHICNSMDNFLLKIGESTNISSKAVPFGIILSDK
jgi:hypothetical protein